jgi:hypothetical protein
VLASGFQDSLLPLTKEVAFNYDLKILFLAVIIANIGQ